MKNPTTPAVITPESPSLSLIAGLRPVLEAIEAGRVIDRVLLRQGMEGEGFRRLQTALAAKGIPMQFVPSEKLNRLTPLAHQGVVAYVPPIEYADIEAVLAAVVARGEQPLVLLLDGVTDVRNFGGIARSASCAGVHLIILPAKGAAPVNAEAIKTSAGALQHIPVARSANIRTAVYLLKALGIQIVAATEKAAQPLYAADFTRPTAIIAGAEDTGISAAALKLADASIRIPLRGPVAALNVSAATAIVLFEAVRQRELKVESWLTPN
ncbi:MAG: 23S rRNA (guanosine(2251)-2'-O)-methyltransferase RlmB [Prevotellaceae bacterium]|jgi:23S rRNA (guanosine2251-2'-O)-methyltransferase|nr:23S rRNA (guanosine(2251)-2'-O)-methyltransferase RlmB [Prevotellaceae bacterium]